MLRNAGAVGTLNESDARGSSPESPVFIATGRRGCETGSDGAAAGMFADDVVAGSAHFVMIEK